MMYERIVEWLQSHGAIRGRVPDSDAEIYERVTHDGVDPVPEATVASETDNETASPPERTRSGGSDVSEWEPVPDVALHDSGDESNASAVSADTIYPWDSDDETESLDEDEINDFRNIVDEAVQDTSVSANTEDGVQINQLNASEIERLQSLHHEHPGIVTNLDDE